MSSAKFLETAKENLKAGFNGGHCTKAARTFGCGSKTGAKNGTLVSGNIDQNLRNPSCLILSHTHLTVGIDPLQCGAKLAYDWRGPEQTRIPACWMSFLHTGVPRCLRVALPQWDENLEIATSLILLKLHVAGCMLLGC